MKPGILAAGVIAGLGVAFGAQAQDISRDEYMNYIRNNSNRDDVLNRIGGKEGVIAAIVDSDEYKNSICYSPDTPEAQVTDGDMEALNEKRRETGKDLRIVFHTVPVSKYETFYCVHGADYAVKVVPGM